MNYGTRSLDDWDRWAPWYALWLAHCDYHRPVKNLLVERVRPGWRVLDAGGGTGVLSLFLHNLGCRPVLLEPAPAMRSMFIRASGGSRPGGVEIEASRWEDLPFQRLAGFDLILACNSFHVTSLGIARSLDKTFAARPDHVCFVAEDPHLADAGLRSPSAYELVLAEKIAVENSWVYHTEVQALAHAQFRKGGLLSAEDSNAVLDGLVFEDGHYRLRENASVRLHWWTRVH